MFVSQTLRSAAANEIMGRGVQLDDLSEVLPPRAASREILVELNTIDRLAAALADGTQRKPRRRT